MFQLMSLRMARRCVACLALLVTAATGSAVAQSDADHIAFLQFSDVHWGFSNPKVNQDFAGTFQRAIDFANTLPGPFDFAVFSGDQTHGTASDDVRVQRMTQFKAQAAGLKIGVVHFLTGEHDASFDNAVDYRKFFGDPYYTFDVKGVHFVCLDNTSTGDGTLGDTQLQWLSGVLGGFDKNTPLIVFAHRPLLDVYDKWDWRTEDAAKFRALVKPFAKVTVFYGHIHQRRTDSDGNITQYADQGLMFPLPAPGSTDKPNPVAWDPKNPYHGLGFRSVVVDVKTGEVQIHDYSLENEEAED